MLIQESDLENEEDDDISIMYHKNNDKNIENVSMVENEIHIKTTYHKNKYTGATNCRSLQYFTRNA